MGNKFKYLPYTLGLMFIFLVIGMSLPDNDRKVPKRLDEPLIKNVDFKCDTFISDSLIKRLSEIGVKKPKIVYAQARLETGNFKSKLFINNNNLFGFRNKKGYLYFSNWQECIQFYKSWQDKHYKGGDYFQFLINIKYAEDSSYINKLKLCMK